MRKKTFIAVLIVCSVVALILAAAIRIFLAEVKVENTAYIYIKPDTTNEELYSQLREKAVLNNLLVFKTCAMMLGYNKELKTGCYKVEPNMKVLSLVSNLRHGRQTPVRIVIGKSRVVKDFAEKISQSLMFSSEEFINELKKEGKQDSLFFFIVPNTYEVYWNVSPANFLRRMERESARFWQNRAEKLRSCGLTRREVAVIASIVEEETGKNDEKARIAGVYLNRLAKRMKLQADPTVKYALQNFELKRIRGEHLQVVSPYNTYRVEGLPPTPICIPSMQSLDAVLNCERHNYLFFCAREDFSGYHNFASTAEEHISNSRKYHSALNRLGIN